MVGLTCFTLVRGFSPPVRGYAELSYSNNRYEPAIFPNGTFEGTPEEAFETSAGVYLSQ